MKVPNMKIIAANFLIISILFSSTLFGQIISKQTVESKTQASTVNSKSSKYFVNLTQLAAEGKIVQSQGFEREVAKISQIFRSKTNKSAVLIDEYGNYRNFVVQNLAVESSAAESTQQTNLES